MILQRTHAVCNEYSSRREALFSMPSNIRHADCDNEANHAAESTRDGISYNRCGGMESPLAFPDDCAAGDYRKTANNQHEYPDIRYAGTKPPGHEYHDEAESPERELEEDGVESTPPERRDDQRTEPGHRTVHRVRGGHHDSNEPDLDVEHRLLQLRILELRAADPSLAVAQALHSSEPLLLRQEPGLDGRARDREAEDTEQEGQSPGEHVDVLPRAESTGPDLREAVVEAAPDHGPEAGRREPPALAQRLLRLRVVAAHCRMASQ